MEIIPTITAADAALAKGIEALRSLSYAEYLQTNHWKRTRNHALRRAGFHCSRCNANRELQVHHLTYERLGAERDSDLEVLCKACHENHHAEESRKQHLGVYIKLVSDAIRQGEGTNFADLSAAVEATCRANNIRVDRRKITRAIETAGSDRMVLPVKRTYITFDIKTDSRPIGAREAADILRSLGLSAVIRTMPASRAPLEQGAIDEFKKANGLWRIDSSNARPYTARRPHWVSR